MIVGVVFCNAWHYLENKADVFGRPIKDKYCNTSLKSFTALLPFQLLLMHPLLSVPCRLPADLAVKSLQSSSFKGFQIPLLLVSMIFSWLTAISVQSWLQFWRFKHTPFQMLRLISFFFLLYFTFQQVLKRVIALGTLLFQQFKTYVLQ